MKHMELLKNRGQSHSLSDLFPAGKPSTSSINTKSFSTKGDSQQSLMSYISKDDVLDAEILWALKCIESRYSYNSCEGSGKLFCRMFKDSGIAKQFSCGATKCAYVCCFGLAPYFKANLLKYLDDVKNYTVLFDETLNKTTQSKQMDIHVRFWHDAEHQIVTRYLTSVFIGHSTADNLLSAFYQSTDKLKLSKILQLSMDGPNVNWKFFELLQADLKKEFAHDSICIGSCGLHILNNAFKYGENSTGWNICGILTALNWLFKDSPARREDYIKFSTLKKFPQKFCNHRWLESIPAIERAIEIWPDIIRYVKNVEKGTCSTNRNKSYLNVWEAAQDKSTVCKFHIFLSIAKLLRPFLEFYQNDAPLLPFLSDDIVKLSKRCVEYYNVYTAEHSENFSSAVKLCKFDFSDASKYNATEKITLGFSADKLIKELLLKKDLTAKEAFSLRLETQKFVINMLKHLMRKCPINYALVRSSSCFDPRRMVAQPSGCQKSLKQMLMHLSEKNIVLDNECDDILLQYKHFLENVVSIYPSLFETFNPEKTRLDTFLHQFVNKNTNEYDKIWVVMKIIFTLSHGQASVERGFSVNKKLEVENMAEESYVAQRLISDSITSYGDIMNIPINKEMQNFVSAARQKYILHLEEKQKIKKREQTINKRKLISDEMEYLKAKKNCLESDVSSMGKKYEALVEKAEKNRDISLFMKSNSLRKTIKDRNDEIKEIENKISLKSEELHKCT